MERFEFFHSANADYIERLYEQYRTEPESMDRQWAAFFAGLELGSTSQAVEPTRPATPARDDESLPEGVYDLVHSYRELGHFIAKLDPLGHHRPDQPLLELSEFGFDRPDLERQIGAGNFLGPCDGSLRGLIESLRHTYCETLGVEYMDIPDKDQRLWLQERMEPILNRPKIAAEDSRQILAQLVAAEGFEQFLHTKYIGQKRFSIEGAESLIPMVNTLVEQGAALGAEEIILGMAHRGRLNVLAHVLRKPYEIILGEFEGTAIPQEGEGDGDVKYHLGYSNDRMAPGGRKVHCSLCPNPSHLELVNPVVEGIVRAKQQYLGDHERSRVVPVLIHGEAAFTGQGIVHETLSLSELPKYRTGGTIHIIINNQLGYTAPADQTRFTPYPTDVAKMIQAPVFHVNADDPEAVVHAARLAIAFRQQFRVDVMIDLWCFRRHGHNETDEPTFTQPLMYREIAKHPSVRDAYAKRLMGEGRLEQSDLDRMIGELRDHLDSAFTFARELRPRQRIFSLGGVWKGMTRAGTDWSAETGVSQDVLSRITESAARLPNGFSLHPKLKKLFESRAEMARGDRRADWGCAELWAIGSLLLEGTHVRLTGQDTERGTFGHRHAVLHDSNRRAQHIPLAHLAPDQASFTVVNTMLSELAVLGFEYGFSWADPRNLVIWEAQFGDFVNGAQSIIDQFISSAESKWQRMSGLTMLLPHGYEGQGPEHSSARLERFLQLCAEDNLQVCYPTQSAQYFHALRRQVHRKFRKPLIILTPKSLLRDDRSSSQIEDFTRGNFRLVIDDPDVEHPASIRRLLICSGKVYFALAAARSRADQPPDPSARLRSRDGRNQNDEDGRSSPVPTPSAASNDVAIVRVEQLYPFPKHALQKVIARYPSMRSACWVQEEPRNMGAWSFMEPRLREILPGPVALSYSGRDEAASPASGSVRMHQIEEEQFVTEAYELRPHGTDASDAPGDTGDAGARVAAKG